MQKTVKSRNHGLVLFNPSAEKQSVYSTAPDYWARARVMSKHFFFRELSLDKYAF